MNLKTDSITIVNPSKILNTKLDWKLKDYFSFNNDIYFIGDNSNDSIFIIKNFNTIVAKLKYPENYRVSNNAPFVTLHDSTFYFLAAFSGNLFKYKMGADTTIVLVDSLYKNKIFSTLGLSIAFYPVNNTFNKQIFIINNELYFKTMPAIYNDFIEEENGLFYENEYNYPIVAKYNFSNKSIDTLSLRVPSVPDYLKRGIYSSFYLCFLDSQIVCNNPSNNYLSFNLTDSRISYSQLYSKFHQPYKSLSENDDIFHYYYNEPFYGQIIFNPHNKLKAQLYFHKQHNKKFQGKGMDVRPKNLMIINEKNQLIDEIIVPDSLSGFHKFAHKNEFYFSKALNNDSLITFYKFTFIKSN
ncbi:MAG: hypothetical protein ACK4IK_09520 [Bacteroidia bacterium]